MIALWRSGALDFDALITGTRPLDDAPDALETLARGEAIRTVLVP